MTGIGGYVVSSAISGMIGGAIGASAATGNHPVLKGALVTGAVSALTALVFAAGAEAAKPLPAGVSGPPSLRFP